METQHFSQGTCLHRRYPWGTYHGGRALCPDGKVRAIKRIATTADTYFSVPASVTAHGRTVSGYVTVQGDEDPTLKFIPYTYGKNAGVFA